jgi:ABC-type sugar transport system ATPase subunit
MGENGAGKSTMIRIMSGAHQPSSGDVVLDGDTFASASRGPRRRPAYRSSIRSFCSFQR